MKLPSFDSDLNTEQKVLTAEGVVGVVTGLTMLGHPKTAHVRIAITLRALTSLLHPLSS